MTTRENYVSLNEAADYLSVSRRTLERYISERRIRAYRLGRSVRLKLSEIDQDLTKMGAA